VPEKRARKGRKMNKLVKISTLAVALAVFRNMFLTLIEK